jgi:4-alpha-glucanotransferase
MSENGQPLTSSPFQPAYRASGLLLHVTSLPSPYGIGDVGPSALTWIDRLEQAGQSWWQALPLGPTGYGNSPYQSLSSFAGNELLISPDWLIEDELLRASDCEARSFPQNEIEINYKAVIAFKQNLLKTAWANFRAVARADLRAAYQRFLADQGHWLEDYALFRALKTKFDDAYYLEWPAEFVKRERTSLDKARRELADSIGQACFAQFLLFRQGERLKAHAHDKGLGLIGDLPFFVSPDSSDVWAHPELFLLDEERRPRFVAGVPPDYFSARGQLWGNPIYDWDALRKDSYRWYISRLKSLLAHVDVIRLDHFRGFAAAWHVPAGAATAELGKWVPGPGADLLQAVKRELHALPFIVEDLGLITPDVYALRDQFDLPGTRVLQFAFDGNSHNPYLPSNYVSNTVVYTGTHDNPTTRNWFEELPNSQRQILWSYLGRQGGESREAAPALMELAWSSVAALSIAPLQDLLNLGREARMNVPGRADGNWAWRFREDMLSDRTFEWLRDLTKNSNRFPHTGEVSTVTQPEGNSSSGRGFVTPSAV